MQVKGPMKMKKPTEVNLKHGSGQKFNLAAPALSHFRNDGAAVECSTLVLLQFQLAITYY